MAEDQPEAVATKYVVITGGVVSGLGKGVTASSVGVVLKACGLRVTCIKIGSCASLPPSLPPPVAFLPLKPKETLRLLVLGVDGRGAHIGLCAPPLLVTPWFYHALFMIITNQL
jgi:hypothetical protein